jgi:hypothetical protein
MEGSERPATLRGKSGWQMTLTRHSRIFSALLRGFLSQKARNSLCASASLRETNWLRVSELALYSSYIGSAFRLDLGFVVGYYIKRNRFAVALPLPALCVFPRMSTPVGTALVAAK